MCQKNTTFLLLCLFAALSQTSAQAHFPWLVRNQDGRVSFYFGEGPSHRTYKLPPSLVGAEVFQVAADGKRIAVPVSKLESEEFIGLSSETTVPRKALLAAEVTYGIYHGSRLDYIAIHNGHLPENQDAYRAQLSDLELNAQLVDTDTGVAAFVTWNRKPLSDTKVHLYNSDGEEIATATTDPQGKVFFTDKEIAPGLNAIMLGFDSKEAGRLKDADYDSRSRYLTLTFYDPEPSVDVPSSTEKKQALPELPIALTSFGGVRLGDALYIYGGHTGEAHSYSTESQSNQLLRLKLNEPTDGWQVVSTGPRLQGLGMVAHESKLILLGGFTAENAPEEEHDLHSQSSALVFDTSTKQWSELLVLPEPRSSHDAAVIGDTVYVVGGWNLQGEDSTVWHSSAWSMNLSDAEPQWTKIKNPPFTRRALALVAHQNKLYAIGGMEEQGGPTKSVDIYDTNTKQWTQGPSLIGKGEMAGFGAAGWTTANGLVVTTYEGDIQRLEPSQASWQVLGKSDSARFFHRMLPLTETELVMVGGANMENGKFLELESITLP